MAATSYNGWTASKDPKAIKVDAAFSVQGHKFPGGVKAGDVATVLGYVVEQLDARVEPIDRDAVKDEWGYHYKLSANSPSLLSCHSSATAIDFNATRHPNGKRHTFTAEQVGEIRRILGEVDNVVRWLGDANRVPDEMHFEIRGTPAQVAVVAARLRKQPAPPTPAPTPEDDMFGPTDRTQLDAAAQQLTNLPRNGIVDYGGRGSDLNDYRVLADGRVVQIVNGSSVVPLGDDAVPGSMHGPNIIDTAAGPGSRVDFTVELSGGEVRWFTFDPSRTGFPDKGDLPAGAHLVPKGGGWHFVDIGD